jgi:leucyl aminopeptidase
MKLTLRDSGKLSKTELLCVLAPEGKRLELPGRVELPSSARRDFRGEFRQTRLTDAPAGPAARVLLIGLGKPADLDAERLRRAAAIAVKQGEALKLPSVSIWLGAASQQAVGGAEEAGRALAEGAVMGSYSFTRCKGKKSERSLASVQLIGSGAAFARGARHGELLGEANLYARELQDMPGNRMRPRDLVAAARKVAARSPRITCRALGEAEMEKLGMGCLLSVSKGSSEPAFLIHLTYKPKGRSRGRIAVVGKGLTFDAGGISLKPSAKMEEMKYDMSGGAAVLGLFWALARADVPFEVHGLVPTSENLPDGKANKPGDVVEAMNGTTVEVLNTDAEGRLILCDALAYAVEKLEPDRIIDLATLTGAVIIALGHELSGVMGNDEKLQRALVASGKAVGELVWPLPMLDCHKDQMKGSVADLRNINAGQGNGSTAGAAFLSSFVRDVPWAHLDIAGTAWGAVDRDYVGGNSGSGVGVRLLLHYLENGA